MRNLSLLLALAVAAPAAAQVAPAEGARVQTESEALAQDAADYARRYGVAEDEALRRLRAQQESVATTDRLQDEYRPRLAGIFIDHQPQFRIVVLLTGTEPVADRSILAGGINVPIVFRTGAPATRDEVVAALWEHQGRIRSRFPRSQGMGADPRSGELVVMARSGDVDPGRIGRIEQELGEVAGVPVRIRLLDAEQRNSDIEGGARVAGADEEGRRFYCTTGFVVTDGRRTGVVTAAHCPDALTYYDPGGGETELSFVGGWGARHQDVQVHVSAEPHRPLFYADRQRRIARAVSGRRLRASTRAGDTVCHRGEASGYSCSEVELVDYAPPGDLCGGPCDPVWVTAAGPSCRAGDSGGPIFSGTTAFGIVKGSSYRRDGRCNFYFYMSTDYLPAGWSLLLAEAARP